MAPILIRRVIQSIRAYRYVVPLCSAAVSSPYADALNDPTPRRHCRPEGLFKVVDNSDPFISTKYTNRLIPGDIHAKIDIRLPWAAIHCFRRCL